METLITAIDDSSLPLAKSIIERGGAVAFPTETVYGLGANAFDTAAVENIFEIKGRPNDNPLIVHVHKDYDINRLVDHIPAYAKDLADAFLPGPLTMVYKSSGRVSRAVSCGLNTLAVRIPSHAGAQEFLKYVGLPIAAPSANLSKHVSPTSARHVWEDLNGKIELILDGGACSGGIESTVLDCTGEIPIVLRSGLVTREMIARVAGCCGEYKMKEGEPARSPGMKYKHYSPRCGTLLFKYDDAEKALDRYVKERAKGVKAVILCESSLRKRFTGAVVLELGSGGEEIAANLYGKLREGEIIADLLIVIAPQERGGVMTGVMNRLEKACGSKYES